MTMKELTEEQRAVWDAYQRMRIRLSGRLNQEIGRATGLSEADFEILSWLLESPDESVRALELRCGLEWEKSRLSHQLRRMEQRGLVRREECAEDNRAAMVRITGAGRERVEAARSIYERAVGRLVMDALTGEQVAQLGEIAETILQKLDEPTEP